MTVYFSYIGDFEGEDFQWDDPSLAKTTSNLPRRLIPTDNFENIGTGAQWAIQQVNAGRYDGRQLDWGAWGLKMTGAELRALFGDDHRYADAIAALTPDKFYVLVAGEIS